MMKHRTALNWVLGTFSIAFFFIIGYALFQLNAGEAAVEKSLDEWEQIESTHTEPEPQILSLNEELKFVQKEKMMEMTTTSDVKKGDILGKITIPKINIELPIIYGTDEEELERGVGHYIGTAFPGQDDNVVLSGHRDTVFKRLDELQVGDTFEVETLDGDFIYEIYEGKIVESDDRTVIVPHTVPVLTLITCYPFNFIGDAPQRYILTARLKANLE